MSDEATYAGIGTAMLSSGLDGDGPYTINGIALGAGDITVGSSGIKKKWPAEELEKAASTLEGQPLVRDHENNTSGRVGTVTKAWYQDGVGVRYEAEIASHYEELAQDIASGIQEVSARAYHDPVDELEEDENGALITTNLYFDNLSVVSDGASPSNTAEIGSVSAGDAVAMASGPQSGAVATLHQGSPRPAELATHKFDTGDWVKGQSSGGTWHGKVRDMKDDGCFDEEIDGDQQICAGDDEPVYLIENYDPEDGEFTDTMVAHKEGSISMWDHEENALKTHTDVMAAELEVSMDELDEVYDEWDSEVNMTASQLEDWSEHPCADKASVDPEAVRERNMMLLETNKSEWGEDEIEAAKRTISFISRMSDEENEPDDPRDGPSGCPSKWAISLLNWAHNPFDSMPEVPDDMQEENESDIDYEAADGAVWFEVPDPETEVVSPVNFVTGTHGFTVESATEPASQGHGHLAVLVNEPYVDAGETVPGDDTHIHLARGQKKFELDLPDGEHTIRLQAMDSNHRAYDMRDRVDLTVIEGSTEENSVHRMGTDMREDPDMTVEPRAMRSDTPEWEEGDMVRWQVEPDLFGKIVHVDEQRHIVMVEIMGMSDGSMESTGFTISAGFSDITPLKLPRDKADMSGHKKDEMADHVPTGVIEELAEVNGLDVNGLVMWDDMMGVIAGFEEEDGSLMVELEVMERDDGSFKKTGDTVMKPLMEVDSMATGDMGPVAELESAWHTPDWSGLNDEKEWSKPNMEDFDTDDLSEIDDHFFVSKTGEWPPENYGDLALPVVWPNGELSLDGLDSAHQMAAQTDGVSESMAESIKDKANALAEEHFDQAVADEQLSVTVAATRRDDPNTENVASSPDIAVLSDTTNDKTMNVDYYDATQSEIEEMSDAVVIERTEIEELQSKADEAEELSERLEEMNSSLDELAANHEKLEDVDEDRLDELREYDSAVVMTESEHEELQGLVDDIGSVFADELAEYSPFESEELQARFTPLELRDKVEDHDEASIESELGEGSEPEPEGGSVDSDELSGSSGSEDGPTEEEVREKVAADLEADDFDRQAEKVRSGDISLEQLGIDTDKLDE